MAPSITAQQSWVTPSGEDFLQLSPAGGGPVSWIDSTGTVRGNLASTIVLKTGTGAGSYTRTGSTGFADVDTTNLGYTVTVPLGWKLAIAAQCTATVTTGVAIIELAISVDANPLVSQQILPAAVGAAVGFSLNSVLIGDGISHVITLQFRVANSADTMNITNASFRIPTMTFILSPSN